MSTKVIGTMFVLMAVVSLGQAELQVGQAAGVSTRTLLQASAVTCPLANNMANNTLPTTKDANVTAYVAAANDTTNIDFNLDFNRALKCAAFQCALYPFLAPALPASPTYDAYLASYYNPCKSRIYDAILPLVSLAEQTVINAAENACFNGNKFLYKSDDNEKKNALSCGGRLLLGGTELKQNSTELKQNGAEPARGKSRNLGPIIGGAAGGIILLGLIAGGLAWRRRRRSEKALDTLLLDVRDAPTPALKPKPLVPGYQWVSQMAEGRSFLQAGVNDVQLDTQKQGSPEGWTSPVIQLTSEQVQDQIQLLSDMPMGSGACGHVYKCVWESRFPGALLAAKILPKTAKYYDLAWQSFQHETTILKSINHPNIVRIYGFCLDQPTVCIIMELLDFSVDRLVSSSSWLAGKLTSSTGVPTPITTDISNSQASTAQVTGLADGSVVVSVNETSTSMTMKRVLRIAIDVAAGLDHLHAGPGQRQTVTATVESQVTSAIPEDSLSIPSPEQIGVVIHRDVKPDNMLVNAIGQTKLCDFGISRETLGTVLQTRHEGAGTDRYMAPELLVYRNNSANSGVVGKKVDIYSLGIVLYELVSHRAITAREAQLVPSGVRPSLITNSDPEAVQARLRELECSEEVLKQVEGIISRCWHHLPNKRPTAAELKLALMEVQDNLLGTTRSGFEASE